MEEFKLFRFELTQRSLRAEGPLVIDVIWLVQ